MTDVSDYIKALRRPKKIAVCTAWGSPFSWTHSMYNLMNLDRPEGVQVKFIPGMGRDPARRHMWGVERALQWGASHICFLGADQMHDMDILVKFTKHIEDGWPAVTAMVPARGWVRGPEVNAPFLKFAYGWKDDVDLSSPKFSTNYLKMVTPKDGDYVEVVVIGSGAIMFDVQLLYMMDKPWFREWAEVDENAWRPAAMDTFFCWRLVVEAGAKILCDNTINIIHLDVFPIDESYSERFSDWPVDKAEEVIHSRL
jgi:hypothetical protein